jgi:hypothetical protein
MKRRGLLAIGLMILVGATLLAQNVATNPQVGTWKMNVAKSKFSSGTGFKSAISRIEIVPGGVRHTLDTVYEDGTTRHYEYVTAYDGKDRPVAGPSPYGNTTALTRIDTRTVRTVYKKDGKVTVVQISVVSRDGRTRTVTTDGINPKGQRVHNVSVYDRQ